jgi:probable rRNA maturation factor
LSKNLFIKNRQRAIPVNTRFLGVVTKTLLTEILRINDFDLAVYIVRAPEMVRLNRKFLHHEGSTDVITFNYADTLQDIHGEVFICIDDAIGQARQFRTNWPSEIIRYTIHGILHLQGFDDLRPAARRKMKREEDRLVNQIARVFPLRKLASNSKLAA